MAGHLRRINVIKLVLQHYGVIASLSSATPPWRSSVNSNKACFRALASPPACATNRSLFPSIYYCPRPWGPSMFLAQNNNATLA